MEKIVRTLSHDGQVKWREVDPTGNDKVLETAIVQNAYRKSKNKSECSDDNNYETVYEHVPQYSQKELERIPKVDVQSLDMEVINKLINSNTTSESYTVTFHDFGGQDVFASIFNYVLNPGSLYIVVTSMQQLLSTEPDIVTVCFYS